MATRVEATNDNDSTAAAVPTATVTTTDGVNNAEGGQYECWRELP